MRKVLASHELVIKRAIFSFLLILSLLVFWQLKINAQILMTNGEIDLSEVGTSTFTDSGGSFDNYGPNENFTLIVKSTNFNQYCKSVRVSFDFYSINEGDTLKIYDGSNTDAPL